MKELVARANGSEYMASTARELSNLVSAYRDVAAGIHAGEARDEGVFYIEHPERMNRRLARWIDMASLEENFELAVLWMGLNYMHDGPESLHKRGMRPYGLLDGVRPGVEGVVESLASYAGNLEKRPIRVHLSGLFRKDGYEAGLGLGNKLLDILDNSNSLRRPEDERISVQRYLKAKEYAMFSGPAAERLMQSPVALLFGGSRELVYRSLLRLPARLEELATAYLMQAQRLRKN